MDGLNCDPMSFDKECEKTNQFFHKNQKRGDIKSHHYIISFDPADTTECGLNGEKAQALPEIQKFTEGKTIVKVIVVPKRIVNIVVK